MTMTLSRIKANAAVSVIALAVAALLIRLWGIDFGLPYEYHINEHFYYPYAWAMGQGKLDLPAQSHGPSLYLGLRLISQQIAHAVTHPELSSAQFGTLIETDPWPVLRSERIVSAIAGAFTIPIVYLIGRRYRDRRTGLIAAALMAVLFFHVRDSHFGVADAALTLFTAITVWLALRAHDTARPMDFALAGFFAGLTAATTSTSAFVVVPVILAAFRITRHSHIPWRAVPGSLVTHYSHLPWRAVPGLLILGFLLGFVVGYPNPLINFPAFIKDISFLWIRVGGGFEGWRLAPDSSALFYLFTLDWVLSQADTRTIVKQWIESNIAAGVRIALEWPYHTPPLSNGYTVPPNSQREYWVDLVYAFGLADRSIEQYQTDGTQFIIATSTIRDIPTEDVQQEARRRQFYAQLPIVFREIKRFSPRCDGGQPAFIFDQLYGPALDLWNLCYAGPLMTIYQVR
jgi:hypothetical protein